MAFFEISKSYEIASKALDYRSLRQDLISSNIANATTPFYRPQDVHFESYLSNEADIAFNRKNAEPQLQIAMTNEAHLDKFGDEHNRATIFWRDGHLARNDGNSVDLDVESSEMSKNSIMYNAITSAFKRHKSIFSYALDSSKNI